METLEALRKLRNELRKNKDRQNITTVSMLISELEYKKNSKMHEKNYLNSLFVEAVKGKEFRLSHKISVINKMMPPENRFLNLEPEITEILSIAAKLKRLSGIAPKDINLEPSKASRLISKLQNY